MGKISLLEERLMLFPVSTRLLEEKGSASLSISGLDLATLADQYGTPLYLYDASTLDFALDEYRTALQRYYPGESGLTYAGKAFLCLAMAQWVERKGLWVDCTGVGEIAIAVAAGIPYQRILVHGVNKSQADLNAARTFAGTIVVDNLVELGSIEKSYAVHGRNRVEGFPNLWLRLRPGVAVDTHAHIQTGQ